MTLSSLCKRVSSLQSSKTDLALTSGSQSSRTLYETKHYSNNPFQTNIIQSDSKAHHNKTFSTVSQSDLNKNLKKSIEIAKSMIKKKKDKFLSKDILVPGVISTRDDNCIGFSILC